MMGRNDLLICGLDEAGRGAFAGPLVLAAVVLTKDFDFKNISTKVIVDDSKKLTRIRREKAFKLIQKHSLAIDTEIISVEEINKKGIQWANIEGFKRLIKRNAGLNYFVDGRWKFRGLGKAKKDVTCVIHGDSLIQAISAASIVAKCTRDKLMKELCLSYTNYFWERNVGYGTKTHLDSIKKFGLTNLHRLKFVQTALKKRN